MSRIEGYNTYSQMSGLYDANKLAKAKDAETTKAASSTQTKSTVELSERAAKLLEELKSKYTNADFMVADYSSEEEAQSILSRGTKEYSVLIDPETLEQMAADEDVKNQYLDQLDQATGALDDIREQLKDSEGISDIVNIGITISGDGTMLFYAQLERSAELQKERIEAKHEANQKAAKDAAKEASKEQKEEALKKKESEEVKKTTVKAASVEDLIKQIKEVDWEKVPTTTKFFEGSKIDFSV